MMTTYDNVKRYTLRIDSQLFEQIKQEAINAKRSIAKEIELRLENSFKK